MQLLADARFTAVMWLAACDQCGINRFSQILVKLISGRMRADV